jgi:hypothetical protein
MWSWEVEPSAEPGSAEDSQHRPGDRTDQAAKAERAHAQFKNNDSAGSQGSGNCANPTVLHPERMEEITDTSQKSNEKKTKNYQVHRCLLPLAAK